MARRLALPSLVALAAAALSGWASVVGYLWSDYELANVGPFRAMADGRWSTFFETAPVDGPSLLMRAPFVFLASLWGGGDAAIFRLVSVPGLLAGAVLGVGLWEMRGRLLPHAKWSILVVLLAAGNPLTLRALEIGHPEELIGAALCVGAVLAALWDRPWLAAVLLGLALANKAWAVLAVGPVLIALERDRLRVLALAAGIGAAFLAPFLLAGGTGSHAVAGAGSTSSVFQPWQLWWPLGEHGHVVRGMTGILKPDYRAAPDWIGSLTHPLIAFLVVPLSLLWLRRRRADRRSLDLLLLLALLFELRCVLDVANNSYYHLPFLMALLAWEALARARPPVLSLAAAASLWFILVRAPELLSPDAQWALYMAWALPTLAALAWATLGGRAPARGNARWTDERVRLQASC